MDNKTLDKLQRLELMILEEIDRICVKHSLIYTLGYGTLIGAVRHGGFIPWDDDIDVFMPREDYECFVDICKRELKDQFILHCQKTDPMYPLPMTKIRLKDTVFLEKDIPNEMISNGIWVDIFTLDNVKKRASKKQAFRFKLVGCINTIKGIRLGWNDLRPCSVFTKILYLFLKPWSIPALYRLQEKIMQLDNNKECAYMTEYYGCYGAYKQTFKKEDLFPPLRIPFAGVECYVPCSAHNILAQIYGADYMIPPPPEKRKTHNPIRIDFGPYKDYFVNGIFRGEEEI